MGRTPRQQIRSALLAVSVWQVASTVVAAAGSVLLARHLGARLFGAYAVSSFLMTFASLFIDFGIHNSLVRHKGLPDDTYLRTAFTLTLVLTVVAGLVVTLVLAPAAAAWYREEQLRPLISWSFLGVAVSALLKISQSLLEKDLEYRAVVTAEALGTLALYVPATVLAGLGFGVLALATGEVCKGSAMVYCFSRRPFRMGLAFRRDVIRELLGFGATYIGMTLSWGNLAALNPVVVGKMVGLEAAGILRIAEGLANQLSFMKRVADRVSYPVLARVQQDPARVVAAVRTGRVFQFLVGALPLFLFTAVAFWLVPLLFGARWRPVGQVLPLYALALGFNTVFALYSSALVTVGRNNDVTRFHLVYAGLHWIAAPLLVSRYGFLGLPLAGILAVPAYFLIHRSFEARFGRIDSGGFLLRILLPSWAATAAAWAIGRPVLSGALFLLAHAILVASDGATREALGEMLRGEGRPASASR